MNALGRDIDPHRLPSLRFDTAVNVKAIRQCLRCVDQRRYAIHDLVQHGADRSIHICCGDQHDFRIRAAFPMLDGEQPSGLQVPQAQAVQCVEVLALDLAENAPAFRFVEPVDVLSEFCDVRELQAIGGQLTMLAPEQLAQRQPA